MNSTRAPLRGLQESETIHYIIKQFGTPNEPIDDELFENICDEIESLSDDQKDNLYELSLASIELGKPEMLNYLLGTFTPDSKTLKDFKKHVEEYVIHEQKEGNDPRKITLEFERIINQIENPKKKKR
jgi:hypothetical protein